MFIGGRVGRLAVVGGDAHRHPPYTAQPIATVLAASTGEHGRGRRGGPARLRRRGLVRGRRWTTDDGAALARSAGRAARREIASVVTADDGCLITPSRSMQAAA
ncbi:hypothetical protein HBB16_21700 [Pseudonocardia sp. MCCB 268]|nr:hypothetical protein [Pseudonocardia cytotoxica]